MTAVELGEVTGPRISFGVELAGAAHEVWFESADVELALSAEVVAASVLLAAMRAGEPVAIPLAASKQFRAHLDQLQGIWTSWDGELQRVEVEFGPHEPPSVDSDRGTACYFSGGVDSFYAVHRHRDAIDALVHVHGFDIRAHEVEVAAETHARLLPVADQIGLPLISLATNVRGVAEGAGLPWGTHGHGSAMWAVAHALAPRFDRALGASSAGYAALKPWGSHPVTCPLWSSERVECVHTDADVSRSGKVAAIGDWPTAMEHLRVCWQNTGAYNCGRCGKCVRTMLNLEANGVAERCTTLPRFDLTKHRDALGLTTWHDGIYLEDIRLAAGRQGRPDIEDLVFELYAETDFSTLRIQSHGWITTVAETTGIRSSLAPAGSSAPSEPSQWRHRLRRLLSRG